MPDELSIRPLESSDLDRLFSRSSRPHGEEWLERQRRSEVYVAVAELDGTPVARIGLDFTRYPNERTACLWSAHVEPEWQSRGIGTQVIRHLEETALAHGFDAARLAVGKTNARAQRLYERLGYIVVGEEVSAWSYREDGREVNVAEDCWTMEKRLPRRAAD